MSGLGGDEAFEGFERYLGFDLRNIYDVMPGFIRNDLFKAIVEKIFESKYGAPDT